MPLSSVSREHIHRMSLRRESVILGDQLSSGINHDNLGRRILQHLLSYILKDVLCPQLKIVFLNVFVCVRFLNDGVYFEKKRPDDNKSMKITQLIRVKHTYF